MIIICTIFFERVMKRYIFFLLIIPTIIVFSGCNKSDPIGSEPVAGEKIEVILNDAAFLTDVYLRIPYTLRFREYEKEGLKLKRVTALDYYTNAELLNVEEEELNAYMIRNYSNLTLFMVPTNLKHYYLSVQIPVPLANDKPTKVFHRFEFRDTVNNKDVQIEGAIFSPRLSESLMVIESPLKGNNNLFFSQSTMGYHFFLLFFEGDKTGTCPRFAFDNMQVNEGMNSLFSGNPAVSESYFNYGDTVYSATDGKVFFIRDGIPENNGNLMDHLPTTMEGVPGNNIIVDIGEGKFAFYAHFIPNTITVQPGDSVKVGQLLGRLGNSGYSGMPHLHFNLAEGNNPFMSKGIPFVFKEYTKYGTVPGQHIAPIKFYNSMSENNSVVGFE